MSVYSSRSTVHRYRWHRWRGAATRRCESVSQFCLSRADRRTQRPRCHHPLCRVADSPAISLCSFLLLILTTAARRWPSRAAPCRSPSIGDARAMSKRAATVRRPCGYHRLRLPGRRRHRPAACANRLPVVAPVVVSIVLTVVPNAAPRGSGANRRGHRRMPLRAARQGRRADARPVPSRASAAGRAAGPAATRGAS